MVKIVPHKMILAPKANLKKSKPTVPKFKNLHPNYFHLELLSLSLL